jgi:hypothetical protein
MKSCEASLFHEFLEAFNGKTLTSMQKPCTSLVGGVPLGVDGNTSTSLEGDPNARSVN